MILGRYATRRFLQHLTFLKPSPHIFTRSLSTNANEEDRSCHNFDSVFGDYTGNDDKNSGFLKHLDKAGRYKRHHNGFSRSGGGFSFSGGGGGGGGFMNKDESFDLLSDGVDGKLKEAALLYNVEEGDSSKNSYSLRPDFSNSFGVNNFPKDMRFRRPMQRPVQKNKSEVTTKEALNNADFRNVRFLAQFITEAGIIIKRKQTGISAKAQRKIAREIKTARAFGLMPFTTMGTKAFTFGKTMENRDQDFEYEVPDDDDDEFDGGNA